MNVPSGVGVGGTHEATSSRYGGAPIEQQGSGINHGGVRADHGGSRPQDSTQVSKPKPTSSIFIDAKKIVEVGEPRWAVVDEACLSMQKLL
ncbi:hypothetical protein U1Q18_001343 [Sarracenia purpurea var. burkii]